MSTNETKHTAGPWELVESKEFLHHYRIKAMIPPHGPMDVITGDFMARKPDAELIARAPTLLAENETLRQQNAELVRALENMLGVFDGDGPSNAQLDYGDDVTACQDARAILATVQS